MTSQSAVPEPLWRWPRLALVPIRVLLSAGLRCRPHRAPAPRTPTNAPERPRTLANAAAASPSSRPLSPRRAGAEQSLLTVDAVGRSARRRRDGGGPHTARSAVHHHSGDRAVQSGRHGLATYEAPGTPTNAQERTGPGGGPSRQPGSGPGGVVEGSAGSGGVRACVPGRWAPGSGGLCRGEERWSSLSFWCCCWREAFLRSVGSSWSPHACTKEPAEIERCVRASKIGGARFGADTDGVGAPPLTGHLA